MATAQSMPVHKTALPPLENGDHLDQKTYHERYEAMPVGVRAELIGGIVYMASPQKMPHGRSQTLLIRLLDQYAEGTPGTEVLVGTTNILADDSEPEPDGALIILPECGGQTWIDEDGYLNGAAELIAEVSWASESIDLNAKKSDYEKAGVREYVAIALRMQRVFWFVRRGGKFKELSPDNDGVFRSETFPGLWLDSEALLERDRNTLLKVLAEGLASEPHAKFAAKLGKS